MEVTIKRTLGVLINPSHEGDPLEIVWGPPEEVSEIILDNASQAGAKTLGAVALQSSTDAYALETAWLLENHRIAGADDDGIGFQELCKRLVKIGAENAEAILAAYRHERRPASKKQKDVSLAGRNLAVEDIGS